jgi:hypothetical protein
MTEQTIEIFLTLTFSRYRDIEAQSEPPQSSHKIIFIVAETN